MVLELTEGSELLARYLTKDIRNDRRLFTLNLIIFSTLTQDFKSIETETIT